MHQSTPLKLLWLLRLNAASRSSIKPSLRFFCFFFVILYVLCFQRQSLFDFYLPHPLHAPDLAISDFYLFPNLKTNLCGRIFENGEGVIDAVEEFLGDQEEGFYFLKGKANRNIVRESASRQREIVLRNDGIVSAVGHFQNTGAENVLLFPRKL